MKRWKEAAAQALGEPPLQEQGRGSEQKWTYRPPLRPFLVPQALGDLAPTPHLLDLVRRSDPGIVNLAIEPVWSQQMRSGGTRFPGAERVNLPPGTVIHRQRHAGGLRQAGTGGRCHGGLARQERPKPPAKITGDGPANPPPRHSGQARETAHGLRARHPCFVSARPARCSAPKASGPCSEAPALEGETPRPAAVRWAPFEVTQEDVVCAVSLPIKLGQLNLETFVGQQSDVGHDITQSDPRFSFHLASDKYPVIVASSKQRHLGAQDAFRASILQNVQLELNVVVAYSSSRQMSVKGTQTMLRSESASALSRSGHAPLPNTAVSSASQEPRCIQPGRCPRRNEP